MGIEKQGKKGLETPTTRGKENKPHTITKIEDDTKHAVKKILKQNK